MNCKKDRAKWCRWFLENVREEATAREMSSYAIERKLIKNNVSMGSNELAGVMRTRSCFKNRKEWTTNRRGVKSSRLCYWSLKDGGSDL